MANKRKYRRFIRRCETEFNAGGKTYRGISSDFSASGLFIRTQNPFPPDTVLDIKIHLPDKTISAISGLVRRASKNSTGRYLASASGAVQKSGMGVELIDKDAQYLDFLRSFLIEEELSSSDIEVGEVVESLEQEGNDEEDVKEELAKEISPLQERASMSEMLIHLITTQQALLNLLDSKGIINKRDMAEEMKKLRKK